MAEERKVLRRDGGGGLGAGAGAGKEAAVPPAWAREARDHLEVLSDKMWQQIRSEANVKFFPG